MREARKAYNATSPSLVKADRIGRPEILRIASYRRRSNL
jgi:hypothetical protein